MALIPDSSYKNFAITIPADGRSLLRSVPVIIGTRAKDASAAKRTVRTMMGLRRLPKGSICKEVSK